MTYAPDTPFPKEKGDAIRSQDWNSLVGEVMRIDDAKVDGTVLGGRVRHEVRGGKQTVVLDGNWNELEVKGRVVEWTGGHFYLGLENPHPSHGVHIGRQCDAVTLYSGGGTVATLMARNRRVGIGTTAPAHALHVRGDRIRLQKQNSSHTLDMSTHGNSLDLMSSGADLYINNTSEGRSVRIRNLVNISSGEYKDDIQTLPSEVAAGNLSKLRPTTFRFRGDDRRSRCGFISEETPGSLATEDRKGIDLVAITATLTRVVQDQQNTIDVLKSELADLRRQVAAQR